MEPKNEPFLENFYYNLNFEICKTIKILPNNFFLRITGINCENDYYKFTLSDGYVKFSKFYVNKDNKDVLNKIKDKQFYMVELKQIMTSKLNNKNIIYINKIGNVFKSQEKLSESLLDISKSKNTSNRNSVSSMTKQFYNNNIQSNKKIEQYSDNNTSTPDKSNKIDVNSISPNTITISQCDKLIEDINPEDFDEHSDKKVKLESVKKDIISPISNKQSVSYDSFHSSFNKKHSIPNYSSKSSVDKTKIIELNVDNSNILEREINEKVDTNSKNRLSSNNNDNLKESEKKQYKQELNLDNNLSNIDESKNEPSYAFKFNIFSKKKNSLSNNPLISDHKTSAPHDDYEKNKKSKKNSDSNNIPTVHKLNNIQSPVQQCDAKKYDKEFNNIKKENEEVVLACNNNNLNKDKEHNDFNNIEKVYPDEERNGNENDITNINHNRFLDFSFINKNSIKSKIENYSNSNNIENNKDNVLIRNFYELKMAPTKSKFSIKFRIVSFSLNKFNALFYLCIDQQNNYLDLKINDKLQTSDFSKLFRLNGVYEINSEKQILKQEIINIIYNNKKDEKPRIELYGFEKFTELNEDDNDLPKNIFDDLKKFTEVDYLYRNLISKINIVVYATKIVPRVPSGVAKISLSDSSRYSLPLEIDSDNKNRVSIENGNWYLITNVLICHTKEKGYYLKTFYETNCMELKRSKSIFIRQYEFNNYHPILTDYNSTIKFVPEDVRYHFLNDIYRFVGFSLDNNRNPKENIYKKEILNIKIECDSVFIRGTIVDFEHNLDHVYKGCSKCKKETKSEDSNKVKLTFHCEWCNKNNNLKTYYRLKIFVKDELGDLICLNMFDEFAINFTKDYDAQRYYDLVFNAIESIKILYNNHQDLENYDGHEKLEEIRNNIINKKFSFKVDINYKNVEKYKSFNVLGLYPL